MLIRLSWGYLRNHKGALAALLILQVIQSMAMLWLPTLNADIINDGVLTGDIPLIWLLGGAMLGITLLQGATLAGAMFFGQRLAAAMGAHIRRRIFSTVQGFGRAELSEFGAGSLITRSTNDVTQVQRVVQAIFSFVVMAPIMGIGGVVMAIRQDTVLSGVFLVIVPVLAAFSYVMMRHLSPLYGRQQKRVDAVNRILREQLSGVRVIRAFLRQSEERDRYTQANDELRTIWLKIGISWALLWPVVDIIVGMSSAAIIWFGAMRIDAGAMQVGSLIAFINYLGQILGAIMVSAFIVMMAPRAEVSAKRIAAVLATVPEITSAPDARPAPADGSFELIGAGVKYPGAEASVLRDISFRLSPGTTTAVIGATGSGKSTLVHLLTRMLDPTVGKVSYAGQGIRTLELTSLRDKIALVPQKAYLFSGTLAGAITGERGEITDEERVWKALEIAQAADFVRELDGGLNAEVSPGGKNFSGGQRQRLTIARAVYRLLGGQTRLLILDDSFSALDFATDKALRGALSEVTKDIAVLVVAQRVSSIRSAEAIVVLEAGEMVGYGRHEELMESCDTYREIAHSQLSAKEAA